MQTIDGDQHRDEKGANLAGSPTASGSDSLARPSATEVVLTGQPKRPALGDVERASQGLVLFGIPLAVWLFGVRTVNPGILGEVLTACLAVLVLFRFPTIRKFKALGVEVELEQLRQVTREVGHATEKAKSVVEDLMAAGKIDAIQRLSKAADLLTRTILNITGRDAGGLCPNMLDYTHLIQETRDYYGRTFHDALWEFYRRAQFAYSQLVSLQGTDPPRTVALHGEVEAARNVLSEAIQKELYGAESVPADPS
jgi:hypothetical protein